MSAIAASRQLSAETSDRNPDDRFRPMLGSVVPQNDSELADLIEEDGRSRIEKGLPFGLDRYYEAIPDLACKPVVLDAAIDVSLRSLAQSDGCGAPDGRHFECLLRSYPELSGPIRVANLLAKMPCKTLGTSGNGQRRPIAGLPRSVGPALDNGRSRYELIRVLGRGQGGMVCEAIDHLLSDATHAAKVAVKLIPIDPEQVHRQTAEATKARRIDHPGVVRVLDRGLTDQDELFLVYELVTGGDLEQWLRARGPKIDPREAARLVAAIARGVQAAHSAGLVHCDLKPANVLLTADGEPRVSDFGIAALSNTPTDARSLEESRLRVGSLAFSAPEQMRRSQTPASPLVDVYALGGLLFHLVTGELPNGSSPAEVAWLLHSAGQQRQPPSMIAFRPEIDLRLDRICARALQARPEDRYSTAAELAFDLQSWLDLRPIPWMNESGPRRTALWISRSPAMAALSAACLLVIVAGGFASGYFAHRAQSVGERAAKLDSAVGDSRKKIADLYKQAFPAAPDAQTMPAVEIIKGIGEIGKGLPAPYNSDTPAPTAAVPKPAK